MKSYLQYMAFLIIILAFSEVAVAASPEMSDPRQSDLMVELERQHKEEWQQKLDQQFMVLESWFSPQDHMMMEEGMPGLPVNKMRPGQLMAVHDFLGAALGPTGYLRLTSLLRLHKVMEEMKQPGSMMPTRLLLQSNNEMSAFSLMGPSVSLHISKQDNRWQISSLTLGQWPRQIPQAPQPDLTAMEIHYPFVRWHEATGENILGQTTNRMMEALRMLPSVIRRKACVAEMATENQCLPKDQGDMAFTKFTSLMELSAKGRFLMHSLTMELSAHLRLSAPTINNLEFTWAGTLPADDAMPQDLLLVLRDGNVLWQVMTTGLRPSGLFMDIPPNGAFIGFNNMGENSLPLWKMAQTEEMVPQPESNSAPDNSPPPMSMMPSNINRELPEIKMVGGQMGMTDQGSINWLKNPAFLNGMVLSLGYDGKDITTTKPFQPIVRIKRDGRPHRNIDVTFSLIPENSEEPWLKDFPMTFNDSEEDYRSTVQLPPSMTGKELTIIFNVHEPGTRYEGIYEYRVMIKSDGQRF